MTLVSSYAAALLATAVFVRYLNVQLTNKRRSDVHRLPRAPNNDSHWLFGHELAVWQSDMTAMYTCWQSMLGKAYRIKAAFWHEDLIRPHIHAHIRYSSQQMTVR